MANINMRIDDDLKDEFYKIAKDNVQTPSALIRKWINEYIEENKKENVK